MPNQVEEAVKDARLAELQNLLWDQTRQFNEASIGKVMSILLDRPGRRDGQLVGRSPYMQPVHVDNAHGLLGRVAQVRIAALHPNSLAGELVSAERQSA
jgi:tRNA-2-methylthio-N6-dimethylallyladenosine synthase